MQEIEFNLNDTVLLGSSSSISRSKENISQLRVNFDTHKLKFDAYKECLNVEKCDGLIHISKANIFNEVVDYFHDNMNGLKCKQEMKVLFKKQYDNLYDTAFSDDE